MGILETVLASIDNMKRVGKRNLSDAKANPAEFASMVQGRVSETNKKLASGDTQEILGAIFPTGVGAIRFQGSPNFIKGTKLDMSKLGTGEGAQVNGKGHYVAEAPAVADRYRESLSIRKLIEKLHDNSAAFPDSLEGEFKDLLGAKSELLSPEKKLLGALHQNDYLGYDTPRQALIASSRSDARTAYDLGDTLDNAIRKMGHLYKIDIPDEAIAKMINFDTPIASQPHVTKQLGERAKGLMKDTTGRDVFKQLESELGKTETAKLFDSLDIPGVTYLDQGSRGKNGTVNNVLFNDDLARILERNGKPTGEQAWQPGEYDYMKFLKESGVLP